MPPELCYERAFALVFEQLKLKCKGVGAVDQVVQLLKAAICNLLKSPNEGKFRRIKSGSAGIMIWHSRMDAYADAVVACMSQLGFKHDRNVERYVLPANNDEQELVLKATLCVLELHLIAANDSSGDGGVIPSEHATRSLQGIAFGDESAAIIVAKSTNKASGCAPAATCRVVANKQPVAGVSLHLDGSVEVQCDLLDSVKLPRWCPEPDQQLTVPHAPSLYRSHKIPPRHRGVACLLEAFV